MDDLVKTLNEHVPSVTFVAGNTFAWSPKHSEITYINNTKPSPKDAWALIHETAHAILGHTSYKKDFELVKMEVSAWEEAKKLAKKIGIIISEDHVQDCLDTYRDWLHQRATCPRCGTVSLQTSNKEYNCHNCSSNWKVSTSRFCRPYRRQSLVTSR